MTTFTSSLPERTLEQLAEYATRLNLPKNAIIEKALNKYFYEIERELYAKSFKAIAGDDEVLGLPEMGLQDYVDQINAWDEKS